MDNNLIITIAVMVILFAEFYGIYYSLQFRERLMWLVPWGALLIITIYLLLQIGFPSIAHAADDAIINWIAKNYGNLLNR